MRFLDPDKERQFKDLQENATELIRGMNREQVAERLATLEAQSADPEFWDAPDEARSVLKELEACRTKLGKIDRLTDAIDEIGILLEMAAEEGSADGDVSPSEQEAESVLETLAENVAALELERLFSGEHDTCNALLEINSGAGGTEAQDWAGMLLRMYVRWAEQNGYKAELLSELRGEEAGIKNVSLRISGDRAYGHLKAENGVHRLVRISPYDSAARRHTSFASVFAMPELDDSEEIEINDKDLRIDTYRASGAGGQHVNKTDSAVRITHVPTNTVVTCQNDRSQHKNKATAMKLLQAKLFELRERERQQEMSEMTAGKQDIAWGSQIRSYVLHPYKMVKDHRMGFDVGDAEKVLDGAINPFTEAYLRWQASGGALVEDTDEI